MYASENGNGKHRDPIPAATHFAICYGVVDLGTQPGSAMYPEPKHKVLLMWELPDERIEFEKDGVTHNLPRAISKQYTVSLSEKSNLRHDLVAWRGKQFDAEELKRFALKKVLGKQCLLTVTHKSSADGTKVFANVSGVAQVLKGMLKNDVQSENPEVYFSFADDTELPETLPDWVKGIIYQSEEWKAKQSTPQPEPSAENGNHEYEEDIPF